MFQLNTLVWQYEYAGPRLQNLRILVCRGCLDKPQPQLQPRNLTPDPLPVMNARPEPFAPTGIGAEQTNYLWTDDEAFMIVAEDGTFFVTEGSYTGN